MMIVTVRRERFKFKRLEKALYSLDSISGSISKDKVSMIQQVKNVKSVEGEYLFWKFEELNRGSTGCERWRWWRVPGGWCWPFVWPGSPLPSSACHRSWRSPTWMSTILIFPMRRLTIQRKIQIIQVLYNYSVFRWIKGFVFQEVNFALKLDLVHCNKIKV